MNRSIVDSDILSHLLRGVSPVVASKAKAYMDANTVLSFTSLSILEVLSGLQHLQAIAQMRRAELLFEANDEIVPETEHYRPGAEIIGALLRFGRPVGFIDPTIAGCAIRRNYGVVSGSEKHYLFIRDAGYAVSFENWRKSRQWR